MFRYATKLADKIRLKETTDQSCFAISDPFAAETAWLAECSPHQPEQDVMGKIATTSGIIAMSGIIALCGSFAVHMGYDWGYRLVEQFFGQPTGANQGIWASQSLTFFIMPLFFGIAFSCQYAWSGARKWTRTSLICAFGGVLGLAYLAGSLNFDIGPVEAIVWSLAAVLFGFAGLITGYKTCVALRTRVRMRALLSCGTAAITLLALGHLLGSTEIPFGIEMLLYALIIGASGAWSARFAHARTREAAVLLALVGTMPIMLANLLNLCGNLLCLTLDAVHMGPHLGWQALLSAVAINVLAVSAAAFGGLQGFKQKATRP